MLSDNEKISGFTCKDPQAWGWVAAVYCIVVVIFGGLVLPTVLIGVVSISFQASYEKSQEEVEEAKQRDIVLAQLRSDMPEFFTDQRIQICQFRLEALCRCLSRVLLS